MARFALPILLAISSVAIHSSFAQQMKPARVVEVCEENSASLGAISFLKNIFQAQAHVNIQPPISYGYYKTDEYLYFDRVFSISYMGEDTTFRDYFILPVFDTSTELIAVNISKFYDEAIKRIYRHYHIGILQKKGTKLYIKKIILDQIDLNLSFRKDYGDSTYFGFEARIDSDGPFPKILEVDEKVINLY